MTSRRLPEGPAELIDRKRPVTFELDGRQVSAFEGDTIGSAMAAAGIRITGRSFKYHRPRGLLCMTGACPNCLATVDGVPNVRACTTPVREGVDVRRQNAWPSAGRDAQGVLNRLAWAMPAGFYYKVFQRPRFLWPMVEPIVRRVAGLGKLPEHAGRHDLERVHLHPDVLVVGAGPAGLAAAIEAARAGARTVLVEEAVEAGGSLQMSMEPVALGPDVIEGLGGIAGVSGHEAARRMAEAARDAGVKILTDTPAFGVFDGPLVAASGPEALFRIRARQTVFATGAIEQPAVFVNNDLPGIMLGSAVDRLLHVYRVRPGRQAVVATTGLDGYRTAAALREAGVAVTVVDVRDRIPLDHVLPPDVLVLPGATVLRAVGRRRIRAVEVGPPDGSSVRRLACDLLVVAGIRVPTSNLLAQAGADVAFDDERQAFHPIAMPAGMHVAGAAAVASGQSLEAALLQGRLAGLQAAGALGLGGPEATARLAELSKGAAGLEPDSTLLPPPCATGPGKQFACLCMDVTEKEMHQAVHEGFDSIELLKRYTTVSMGPCQGKACLLSSIRLCAHLTGTTVAETGAPTARPPWTPVALETLAAGSTVPTKETSIHDRHASLGAEFMWAGDWRRPHHYTPPADECRAVHEGVGVIDVSTLGKLRVKGPDAAEFLERLYPNRFGDLKVGRIRYGVMLNDEGSILDDGTICRLADDEYFVTTTTGGTEAMEKWMEWWLADWALDVQVLNVSAAYAALNVAGPLSRQVMERLSPLDVTADGLPYLMSARGPVAGVRSLVLRIGFVGELGYEIHFPSTYGEYVWDRVLDAGEDLGIVPFGLEAQRILRLEKQHILVGQDTDALSDPFGAGMSWIVKLDKESNFLGRRALQDVAAEGPRERLVGFVCEDGLKPPEGAAVVDGERWVGRVTSSRRSDTAGGVVGMAWVPAEWAEQDRTFDIRFDGIAVRARVALEPFYDPDGTRLRS